MRKKIGSFFFVFMMGCAALSIHSDASTQVYVKSAVNVRDEASNSSKILGVVAKGTKIEKISESRGWTKVSYKGKEAYIASSFLTDISSGATDVVASDTTVATTASSVATTASSVATTASASRSSVAVKQKVYVNHSSVNIRASASSKSEKIGTAKKGQSFYRVESKNGWTKIEYGTGYGYIASQYLSGSATDTTSTTATTKTTTVYVNYKQVNVRAAASSSSKKLGTASRGEAFKSYGTSGAYTKVRYNGRYGYIATRYLSTKKTSTKATTVYVNYKQVNVRASASSSSKKLGTASRGEAFKSYGTSGAYTKVLYKGQYGYIATRYLSTSKTSSGKKDTTTTATVANRYVNVRAAASSKSKLLGKLYQGEKVTVVGKSGSFSKIKYNGSYAYVATAYLK